MGCPEDCFRRRQAQSLPFAILARPRGREANIRTGADPRAPTLLTEFVVARLPSLVVEYLPWGSKCKMRFFLQLRAVAEPSYSLSWTATQRSEGLRVGGAPELLKRALAIQPLRACGRCGPRLGLDLFYSRQELHSALLGKPQLVCPRVVPCQPAWINGVGDVDCDCHQVGDAIVCPPHF